MVSLGHEASVLELYTPVTAGMMRVRLVASGLTAETEIVEHYAYGFDDLIAYLSALAAHGADGRVRVGEVIQR